MLIDETLPQKGGKDKITDLKWEIVDLPGEFRWIKKTLLEIDVTYQRGVSKTRVLGIASSWSWVSCGVLLVAERPMGELFVIDGQHRLMASLKRSDIKELPCMVFKTADLCEEATGFISSNTARKAMASYQKFKASLIAKDTTALFIKSVLDENKVSCQSHKRPRGLSCFYRCNLMARNKDMFEKIIHTASLLCQDYPITEELLMGLEYLNNNLEKTSISDEMFEDRILHIGFPTIQKEMKNSSIVLNNTGSRAYGHGILMAMNKNRRNKFKLKDQ